MIFTQRTLRSKIWPDLSDKQWHYTWKRTGAYFATVVLLATKIRFIREVKTADTISKTVT
jgi:hypothetical protein